VKEENSIYFSFTSQLTGKGNKIALFFVLPGLSRQETIAWSWSKQETTLASISTFRLENNTYDSEIGWESYSSPILKIGAWA